MATFFDPLILTLFKLCDLEGGIKFWLFWYY